MERYCGNCGFETEEIFCPKCASLTYPSIHQEPQSKPGEKFACTIGSGKTKGIFIGKKHREKFFSHHVRRVVLDIEGVKCSTVLDEAFWHTSPVIRCAENDRGHDYLSRWIVDNQLYSPKDSQKMKGKKVYVALEVIRPHKEFKVFIPYT